MSQRWRVPAPEAFSPGIMRLPRRSRLRSWARRPPRALSGLASGSSRCPRSGLQVPSAQPGQHREARGENTHPQTKVMGRTSLEKRKAGRRAGSDTLHRADGDSRSSSLQKSEVRSQRSDDRGQKTVLKNVESLKALQSHNREGELPAPQGERTPRWEIKPAHNDQSRGVVIFPGIHRS